MDLQLRRFVIGDPTGESCWNWGGLVMVNGYGFAVLGSRRTTAHRLAYELLVRPVPRGRVVDHLCRNKRCINPRHLEPVTYEENALRGIASRKAAF